MKQELAACDASRVAIDQRLQRALDRKRYATSPEERASAGAEEAACLAEMDRLMTRIRALEGKLQLIRKGTDPAERWWGGVPDSSSAH